MTTCWLEMKTAEMITFLTETDAQVLAEQNLDLLVTIRSILQIVLLFVETMISIYQKPVTTETLLMGTDAHLIVLSKTAGHV